MENPYINGKVPEKGRRFPLRKPFNQLPQSRDPAKICPGCDDFDTCPADHDPDNPDCTQNINLNDFIISLRP